MAEPAAAETCICDYLGQRDGSSSRKEILAGLRDSPRRIPSRFFYDRRGSELFEEITGLPEYYLTGAEKSILKANADRLLGSPEGLDIVELGSGDCSKVSLLLDAVPEDCLESVCYLPVDVSRSALARSARNLTESYPGLRVVCLRDDFCRCMSRFPDYGRKLILFLGSTIGNLEESAAAGLLSALSASMGPDDRLILGLDMLKDRKVLERAYNDSRGITAEFNRNILRVANRLADTDFHPDNFVHRAFLNGAESRMEMHLEASIGQAVSSPWLDEPLQLRKGERIHTETSRKYTAGDIESLAHNAGFAVRDVLTDGRQRFSLVEMEPVRAGG
ncbi:MAG: L-histidine N(alpha)-methyltransferase [Candidatus Fermentibacteraceae bacterium]